jgi:hypothetical protein
MRRLTTETKQFFKTSEFWVYSAILLAILIAGLVIEREEGGPDIFAADKVWLYATILTAAYLLSRGIAKSGVRDPYWDSPNDRPSEGAPIGERVKAAATALTDGPEAVGSGQRQQSQPLEQQPPPPAHHTGASV